MASSIIFHIPSSLNHKIISNNNRIIQFSDDLTTAPYLYKRQRPSFFTLCVHQSIQFHLLGFVFVLLHLDENMLFFFFTSRLVLSNHFVSFRDWIVLRTHTVRDACKYLVQMFLSPQYQSLILNGFILWAGRVWISEWKKKKQTWTMHHHGIHRHSFNLSWARAVHL